MTRTVTLLRHAKSSWGDASLADFDRPLAERGLRDAPRMAAWLAEQRIAPDLVLCSTAKRTQETLALVRSALPKDCKVESSKAFYMANAGSLLSAIRAVPNTVRHVLMIGHNPGLEDTARRLVVAGDKIMRTAMAAKFPSAGCAVIKCDVSEWADIADGAGTLVHWMTPRGLPG